MKRLAVYLAVLQLLDVASTVVAIQAGAAEGNPVGRAILGGGTWALLATKAVATIVIVSLAAVLHADPRSRGQAVMALRGCCLFMVAVVGWNSWILLLKL